MFNNTRSKVIVVLALINIFLSSAQSYTVLMFVAKEQTYYSEYIVMREALEAAGYTVDLRSATEGTASLYMLPDGTDISETANTMPGGGSYDEFIQQFQALFNIPWDATKNTVPDTVPLNGRIQDVIDMSSYDALVVVGGIGAINYRVDGSYNAQGTATAQEVQEAAEHLNALAVEALLSGKPVMGQCHAASIPAFWRIPGTSGAAEEAMGYSLLKGENATGYPEPETPLTLQSLDVNHREYDRVTVSSPHNALDDAGSGDYKIITTKDWYPQTVTHASRTLLNILETYPSLPDRLAAVSVLILHGGSVDQTNCNSSNRENDIPCNYGNAPDMLPADYTHIQNLLLSDSPNDAYTINVAEIDLTDNTLLPFDPNDQTAITAWLSLYDTVIFFKHWSTGITTALQNALISYADNGGGVLALHHGLYNDVEDSDTAINKDIITQQLFGVESAENNMFNTLLTTYNLFSTNYGHFVSTYGITPNTPSYPTPSPWFTVPLIPVANASLSYYHAFEIYDELYTNMTFLPGQSFGRGVNEIVPVFSNDQYPAGQSHTSGFVKLFDPSNDGSIGKVAFYQPGERVENYDVMHPYGQVIRNTIVWLANDTDTPVILSSDPANVFPAASKINIYPNPTAAKVTISFSEEVKKATISVYHMSGALLLQKTTINRSDYTFNISELPSGIYFLKIKSNDSVSTLKLIKR